MAQHPTISKTERVQTAVEWFAKQVEENLGWYPVDIIEQAKQMEREQKIEFADRYADDVMAGCLLRAEQYYNETYGK